MFMSCHVYYKLQVAASKLLGASSKKVYVSPMRTITHTNAAQFSNPYLFVRAQETHLRTKIHLRRL
jgi:hypothetical protein